MNVNCDNCGAVFHKRPSHAKRTKHHLCSQRCVTEWRKGRAFSPDEMRAAFYDRVVMSDDESCWLWVGQVDSRYGRMSTGTRGRDMKAHRVSYEIHHGPIPDGMYVCHTCDNTLCVNPFHLFIGTQFDNMRDMARKGRGRVLLGAENPKTKLTDASILRITELRNTGMTYVALSEMFGVGTSTIHRVITGRRTPSEPRQEKVRDRHEVTN